jgi:hypothetical protein
MASVLAGSTNTVGLDPLEHAGRPIYSEEARSAAQCCDKLAFVPRPGSFGRMSDLSSASGDRAVAADCPATTDALAGEKSSARWEKRGGWWQATLRDGTTEHPGLEVHKPPVLNPLS